VVCLTITDLVNINVANEKILIPLNNTENYQDRDSVISNCKLLLSSHGNELFVSIGSTVWNVKKISEKKIDIFVLCSIDFCFTFFFLLLFCFSVFIDF
jgi:hypothetical protein